MSWLVVKFDAEDTVEAVPNTWYVKDRSQCYWPSEGTPKNILIDFIKKKRSPQANWIFYEASILGCYGKVFSLLYAYKNTLLQYNLFARQVMLIKYQ